MNHFSLCLSLYFKYICVCFRTEMDGPLNHPPLDALLQCLESSDDDDGNQDKESGASGAMVVDESIPGDGAVEDDRATIAGDGSGDEASKHAGHGPQQPAGEAQWGSH